MKTNTCVIDSEEYMGRTAAICKQGMTAANTPLLFQLAKVSATPLRVSVLQVESSSVCGTVRALSSVSSYARPPEKLGAIRLRSCTPGDYNRRFSLPYAQLLYTLPQTWCILACVVRNTYHPEQASLCILSEILLPTMRPRPSRHLARCKSVSGCTTCHPPPHQVQVT